MTFQSIAELIHDFKVKAALKLGTIVDIPERLAPDPMGPLRSSRPLEDDDHICHEIPGEYMAEGA